MNDIIFQKQQGGLDRPLAGEDHISALLFYSTIKPTAWASHALLQVTSIEHAVELGITKRSVNSGLMYYHIAEFFRINPGATLYVGIYTPIGTPNFAEIKAIQRATEGKIRQIGVFLTQTFAGSQVTLIQGILDDLDDEHMPLEALLAADFSAVTDLTALVDLRTLDCPAQSVWVCLELCQL